MGAHHLPRSVAPGGNGGTKPARQGGKGGTGAKRQEAATVHARRMRVPPPRGNVPALTDR
ncbi:hypothetical protein GCM10011320_28890 [Neoroseomonas lacus]|uniref:Uncharacterized protein n=1 Tax=Neoroseomonas lacus TaxID=287609 RepID=A0A917NQW5_9PROT|nr:hypothetical protein GCM10011320_28890 [Neoroseomonas lacus]